MSKVNKAYKFRIYPNKEQTEMLEKHFGAVRFVYNYFLNERNEYYDKTGKRKTYKKQISELKKFEQEGNLSWLSRVNHQALLNALRELNEKYKIHYADSRKYPKYKRKRYDNCFRITSNINVLRNKIFIPLFYEGIRCKIHREPKGIIRSAALYRTLSGKYYVSLRTEAYKSDPYKKTGKSVGIDLGLETLLTTSDGKKFKNNHYEKKYRDKLKRAKDHLSRKVEGSKSYENQVAKVAKIKEKIANSRMDYLQKRSTYIVKNYDTIYMETLDMAKMKKDSHFAWQIEDAGWSIFIALLYNKAHQNNRKVVRINQWYPSSQVCSKCGHVNKQLKDLSIREWECPECHAHHDRDINAAINILQYGEDQTSVGVTDHTGESTGPNNPGNHRSVQKSVVKKLDSPHTIKRTKKIKRPKPTRTPKRSYSPSYSSSHSPRKKW